jgi:hypothetical protein
MEKTSKNITLFLCKICNFSCSKKGDYNRHLLTAKHQNRIILNKNTSININSYTCENCNKKYNACNSLWYHKKKCIKEDTFLKKEIKEEIQEIKEIQEIQEIQEIKEEKIIITSLINENKSLKDFMMIQQQEFKDLIVEVCKNNQINNTNNTFNNNSHNKTFNLNVFLNEDCKDAMNITEFANSIVINLEELESIGKLGYVNSITNIIKNKLNLLDIHKRPIHCTDLKREIIYIKDNNVWEKDTTNKLLKGVAVISKKNCSMIYIFKDKYPDYKNPTSKQSDVYDILCSKIYHASDENINKVIKKLLKEITIPKNINN